MVNSLRSEFSRFRKGVQFLSGFLTSPEYKLISREINLQSSLFPEKKYRVRVYSPIKKKKRKINAILLIHGMSVMGIDDPRIIKVATSLSKCGYTVFMPELEEVKALKIVKETVDNIYDVSLSISNLSDEFGFTKLGFFSISFTGGLGLISLAKQGLDKILSVIVVGPYAHFGNTLPYVLKHFDKDTYGSFIFLYNFIHVIMDDCMDLEKIFYESAVDNALKRIGEKSVANQLKENLTSKELDFYNNICTDYNFRNSISLKIREATGSLIDDLSPINYIGKINSPIALLHGKDDYVLPESESIELAKTLKEKGKDCYLEITGLLSHGDSVATISQIPYVYGFAKTFGYFLENLEV